MKKFLLAASIAAITAMSAHAALSGDGHTRIRADENTQIFLGESGARLEIRGSIGDQVIDIERDGENRIVRANGAEIIIRGRRVFVNGEELDNDGQNLIILDGDNVTIEHDEDADHQVHRESRAEREARRRSRSAERAERRAHRHNDNSDHESHRSWSDLSDEEQERVREDLADAREDIRQAASDIARATQDATFVFQNGDHEFGLRDLEGQVVESLRLALGGLSEQNMVLSDDWHDLTEEERAEILEEIAEAHEEVRLAMSEVHIDMQNARNSFNQNRHMLVEIRESARAEHALARAEHDLDRAAHDLAREEHRLARETYRHDWLEGESENFSRNIRVERTDDGGVRLWINGEEQDAGEHIFVRGMHIAEGHNNYGANDDQDVQIEVQNGMQIVERHRNRPSDDEQDIRLEVQADGRHRIWVDGEEQTGDDLVRWLNQLENNRLEGANPNQ